MDGLFDITIRILKGPIFEFKLKILFKIQIEIQIIQIVIMMQMQSVMMEHVYYLMAVLMIMLATIIH